MTGDFNIRNNNWNPSYTHYSIYADILIEVADSFNLELSFFIKQVPIQYTDNANNSNLVINLMFLRTNAEEFKNYSIHLDLRSSSNYTSLIVNITINKGFIQENEKQLSKIVLRKSTLFAISKILLSPSTLPIFLTRTHSRKLWMNLHLMQRMLGINIKNR